MADRDFSRQPRWNNTGYWTDERDEDSDRQGDRSRSRNYGREDMRRYGRQSQDQAERLRRLRGQGESWDSGRADYTDREFNDSRSRHRSLASDRGWDWDYDAGPARYREAPSPGFQRGRQPDDRGLNQVDNYWGLRRQQQYGDRDQREWWDNTGGRPDFTSARRSWRGSSAAPRDDSWLDESTYDMDIGYGYEFGTDYDLMDETNLEAYGQPRWQYGSSGRRSVRQTEFWQVPGPYTGMGPRGYQRSDERILEDLCEIFTYNGQIDASGIAVQVQDGQVTIEGDVDRRAEKHLAEDIASSIPGVRDVDNRIRVQAGGGVRVRGMGHEDVVMPGRIQPGMRVAGLDGKRIGQVKEVRENNLLLKRDEGGSLIVPFRAIKRTNGQIILHVASHDIDRQGWNA